MADRASEQLQSKALGGDLQQERPAKRTKLQAHKWRPLNTPATAAAHSRRASATDTARTQRQRIGTNTQAAAACSHDVAIEDLAHLQCGREIDSHIKAAGRTRRQHRQASTQTLLQAPVVPSQSEAAFPLHMSHALLAEETEAQGKSQHDSHPLIKYPTKKLKRRCIAPSPLIHTTLPGQASSSTYKQTPDTLHPSCLLESKNPGYFQQPKFKKWHSSTEQAQDTSGMMLIDPESAIDYTQIFARPTGASALQRIGSADLGYVDEKTTYMDTPMTEASWFTAPQDYDFDAKDGHFSGSEASSLQSSPDALQQPLPFESLELEAPALRGPGFDVDTMFDWDQADALLVDGQLPTMSTLAFERAMADQFSLAGSTIYATSLQATSMQHQLRQQREQADVPPQTLSPAQSTLSYSRESSIADAEEPVYEEPGQKLKKTRVSSDEEPLTQCHNCGVTKTPLWRRTPCKRHSLCNACGLYLKQYNHDRPLNRVQRQLTTKIEEGTTPTVCTNCSGTQTSLWRKDENGAIVCNACGLYSKLHGKARPVGMRKEKVSRRKRFRNLPPSPTTEAAAAAAAAVVAASLRFVQEKEDSASPHSTVSTSTQLPVAA